jgi:hypothetical protein
MSIDTILGIIGTVLGVIGIITGYIFYIRSKQSKELSWAEDEVNFIKGYSTFLKDLKIRYKKKYIENLSVSKVVIWNTGNKTIDKGDIATAIPLMIRALEDTKILDVSVLKMSNPANRFRSLFHEDGKYAFLLFDYLDSNHGAVIQVIHTGTSVRNILVAGEIKGIKEIKFKREKPDVFLQFARLGNYFFLVMLWFLSGGYLYNKIFAPEKILVDAVGVGVLVVTIIFTPMVLYGDRMTFKDTAKIPKELSIFEDDNKVLRKKMRSV